MLYRLSLNAWVEADGLHIDWIYSNRVYKRDTVEALAKDFVERLRQLIAACKSSTSPAWLPEGPEFNWTGEDVQNIATAIGKAIGSS